MGSSGKPENLPKDFSSKLNSFTTGRRGRYYNKIDQLLHDVGSKQSYTSNRNIGSNRDLGSFYSANTTDKIDKSELESGERVFFSGRERRYSSRVVFKVTEVEKREVKEPPKGDPLVEEKTETKPQEPVEPPKPVEKPKTEEPKKEEPKTEEPKKEEAKKEVPKKEETKPEKPVENKEPEKKEKQPYVEERKAIEGLKSPKDFDTLTEYMTYMQENALDPTGDGYFSRDDIVVMKNLTNNEVKANLGENTLDYLNAGVYDFNQDGKTNIEDAVLFDSVISHHYFYAAGKFHGNLSLINLDNFANQAVTYPESETPYVHKILGLDKFREGVDALTVNKQETAAKQLQKILANSEAAWGNTADVDYSPLHQELPYYAKAINVLAQVEINIRDLTKTGVLKLEKSGWNGPDTPIARYQGEILMALVNGEDTDELLAKTSEAHPNANFVPLYEKTIADFNKGLFDVNKDGVTDIKDIGIIKSFGRIILNKYGFQVIEDTYIDDVKNVLNKYQDAPDFESYFNEVNPHENTTLRNPNIEKVQELINTKKFREDFDSLDNYLNYLFEQGLTPRKQLSKVEGYKNIASDINAFDFDTLEAFLVDEKVFKTKHTDFRQETMVGSNFIKSDAFDSSPVPRGYKKLFADEEFIAIVNSGLYDFNNDGKTDYSDLMLLKTHTNKKNTVRAMVTTLIGRDPTSVAAGSIAGMINEGSIETDDLYAFFDTNPEAKAKLEGRVSNFENDLLSMNFDESHAGSYKEAIEAYKYLEAFTLKIAYSNSDPNSNLNSENDFTQADMNVLDHSYASNDPNQQFKDHPTAAWNPIASGGFNVKAVYEDILAGKYNVLASKDGSVKDDRRNLSILRMFTDFKVNQHYFTEMQNKFN